MADRMKPLPTDRLANLLPPIDVYTHIPQMQYLYFENSENHPFEFDAPDFSMVNAWWLADAAMLAYSDVSVVEYGFKKAGFGKVELFTGKTTQCYVARRKEYLYKDGRYVEYVFVVFRGTRAPGKNQDIIGVVNDWRVDLHVGLVP